MPGFFTCMRQSAGHFKKVSARENCSHFIPSTTGPLSTIDRTMSTHTAAQSHPQAHARWQAGQRAEKKQRWSTAEQEYHLAAQLAPHDIQRWMKLATVRARLGQCQGAYEAALQAHELDRENITACRLLAATLRDQHMYDEAVTVLNQLPAHVPRDAAYWMSLTEVLLLARRWPEAIAPCMQLLQADMFNTTAHLYMGLAFKNMNRPKDAALCFETAAVTDRTGMTRARALTHVVEQLQFSAQWPQLQAQMDAMNQALQQSPDAALAQLAPFALLPTQCAPETQLRVSRIASAHFCQGVTPLPARGTRKPGPLRIGYLSNDFHAHATALLMVEMLERHNRARVQVHLYCHSPEDGSLLQQRVRAAADVFRDVRYLSDVDVARLMRDDDIDIAIDLKGQTNASRFHLLAHRPAPVQVSFLGYPGTSGAPFLDYVIGDPIVTPASHAAHYSERIAQMPVCYQPNDRKRGMPAAPTRAEFGLPDDAVVLCCFNQTYKISPEVADLWARIMREAPGTVLWLLVWNQDAARNLMGELHARGIAPERVFFSPTASMAAHQARLQCADLFLDTWPYNAHTTASDALWAGVPVLTVPGQTFASRVAASLVSACGLPQLACADAEAYVQQAVALAQSPTALLALKRHLFEHRMTLPLFDSARFASDFEDLLCRMWARHEAGLPPDHLIAAPAVDTESHKTVTQAASQIQAIA